LIISHVHTLKYTDRNTNKKNGEETIQEIHTQRRQSPVLTEYKPFRISGEEKHLLPLTDSNFGLSNP
jgi:hypothetical protein